MSLFHNHAGFNITNSKLQVVEINFSDNKFFLENVDEEYFSDFLDFSLKETKIISILQDAYNELILRKPINFNFVSFTLPNEFFRVIELPYEISLLKQDLVDNFKRDLEVIYPHSKNEDYALQYIDLSKNDVIKDYRAIVIAAFRRYLRIIHKFCARNNLTLKYADNAHIASNAFIQFDTVIEPNDIYFSLYVAEKNYSVAVIHEKTPVMMKSHSIQNTRDIITGLTNDVSAMEKRGIPLSIVKRSYVSGENISDTLLGQLSESLGIIPVKQNPFLKMRNNPRLLESNLYTEKYNTFTAAAGISLRLF